jgi:type II secretory pathway component PulJ
MMEWILFRDLDSSDLKKLGCPKPEFKKKLIEKWPKWRDEEVQNYWKRMNKTLRQLSKGMGANLDSHVRKNKKELLDRIEVLDDRAETNGLSEEEWRMRYSLEGELEEVFSYEEHIWQQRCSEQ